MNMRGRLAEAKLIKKADGWYVELQEGDGIHSVGPTTEEIAKSILCDVQKAARRASN